MSIIKKILGEARSQIIDSSELVREVFLDVNYDPESDPAEEGQPARAAVDVAVNVMIDRSAPPEVAPAFDERFWIQDGWENELKKKLLYHFQQECQAPFRIYEETVIDKIVSSVQAQVR